MKVHYFVHVTGTDIGISGVPRVVRNLARELVARPDVEFVPVCWSHKLRAIVHAEQKLLDNLSRHDGPELAEMSEARRPIAPLPEEWLLVAEVPHLQSHYPDYPPVHLDEPIGYALACGLKVAVVLHDILPLTFAVGSEKGRAFVEMSPNTPRADADETSRLAFSRYAHATALADLVLPVSRNSADLLRDWLVRHGHRAERLPPIAPALLPEEVFSLRRVIPDRPAAAGAAIEFLVPGFVNAQKNQMTAMSAFLDLIERRPDLDLRLNLVGLVAADVAVPASLMAKRAKGRIVLHGRLSDGQMRGLMKRARATVFVSLAEGFGLPVAESLWQGKPCLCSDSGSIAEIARGGGCLTVNPRSLDEIEAGFETLATDSGRYDELLGEIARRRMKSWKQYAGEIVDALAAVGCGRNPVTAPADAAVAPAGVDQTAAAATDEGGEDKRSRDAVLMVAASDWLVHQAYEAYAKGRSRSLYHGAALHYDDVRDGAAQEEVMFFGPYVPLPAGQYAFTFDGEIDGELKLAFAAYDGRMRILETTLRSFDKPVVIDLPRAVERFEIIGMRTPRLRRLTLRCAFAELRAAGPEAPQTEEPRREAEPAREEPVRVFDDDGAPLRLPFVFPVHKMRVHDAFGARNDNRLRDGQAIAFDRKVHGEIAEVVLFFGPYLHLEPGRYSFRFNGALQGSLKLRFAKAFGKETLRELTVASFRTPIQVTVEEPAEKVEIIGERTPTTRTMRLESIEISAVPLGHRLGLGGAADPGLGMILDRAAQLLRRR